MAENDFQLEELETKAVNKSNNAKRAAVAAGLMAAGAGSALAAKAVADAMDHPTEEIETLAEEDLQNVANTGSEQVPEAQPVVNQEVVVVSEPQQEVTPEDSVDIEFTTNTHYYDENGNLVMNEESGTINGHDFKIIDGDMDGKGDILMVDVDGDHEFSLEEIEVLSPEDNIYMGHPTPIHKDVVITTDVDPEPDPLILDEWDVVDNDIHNDFQDEKTGEVYSNDYAENNENYVNNAELGVENDLAYETYEESDDFVSDEVILG